MPKKFVPVFIMYFVIMAFSVNAYLAAEHIGKFIAVPISLFLLINMFGGYLFLQSDSKRLKICFHGAVLLQLFRLTLTVCIAYHAILAVILLPDNGRALLWSAVWCYLFELVLFWNGIICVYLTSVQLGIKQRVIGIVCGMIPIANLIALRMIVKTVFKEVAFETEKERVNRERASEQICKTKYPLLMVHGVFFRDSNYFNYWGRIPGELLRNGATVYYGNHQSAASVADSADELAGRIKEIIKETGCEKVNIIAHSKGGLDCRYALAHTDIAPYVASITTINTPHQGCLFADYLLKNIPEGLKNKVADAYNTTLKTFGDANPDFLTAAGDLTASACKAFNETVEMPEGVFAQSFGSKLNRAGSGKFPLNFSYHLVKHFDGANDGLVSENSFEWGSRYRMLTAPGKRGISHGDMIDLNRENIEGFDVREFYVELVSELKKSGF